jgi:hypothetical protein
MQSGFGPVGRKTRKTRVRHKEMPGLDIPTSAQQQRSKVAFPRLGRGEDLKYSKPTDTN